MLDFSSSPVPLGVERCAQGEETIVKRVIRTRDPVCCKVQDICGWRSRQHFFLGRLSANDCLCSQDPRNITGLPRCARKRGKHPRRRVREPRISYYKSVRYAPRPARTLAKISDVSEARGD